MLNNNNRIVELDVIRGAALFGILIVNMMSFHSPILYFNPVKWWTDPLDHFTYTVIAIFFQASFYPLFSILFGYSLAIFQERVLGKNQPFTSMAARRFCFLFLVGFIHAVFIWHGDILMVYALLGFLSLRFLKIAPKILLLSGIFLYVTANSLFALFLAGLDFIYPGPDAGTVNSHLAKTAIHIYQQGTFEEITRQRVHDWLVEYNPQSFILLLFTVFPLFLIGAGLSKVRVLDKVESYAWKWKRVLIWSFLFGILFKLLPYFTGNQRAIGYLQDVFGGTLLAVFYACSIVLLFRYHKAARLLTAFSAVGKMSLTNYMLQSIVSTMIFYGYGMEYYGKVTLFNGSLLALSFFILQVLFSAVWMSRHTYGPVEWVWRSITYLHLPKWKKTT